MKGKKILSLLLSMLMVIGLCCQGAAVSAAQASVSMPYKALTVSKGSSVTLKAEVKGVTDYTLTWSSSDKSVAKVDGKGKVTGLKNGSSVITVKVKGTNASADMTVTVGKRVSSVDTDKKSVTLKTGESFKPVIKVSPSDAANKAVSYTVSDKNVVSVSGGKITALKEGTANVTVKAADGSGKSTVIKVTVSGKADTKPADKPAAEPSASEPAANVTGGFNKDITSIELMKKIKVGWNLGNSLDALGSGINSETAWGNPKTTKKMITDIKKAGFNAVRIPVSWGRHCDSDGNVDKEWMKRVKEVVDYAYSNNMYVILNSHHDNSYYLIGDCAKSDDSYKASSKKMKKLWTQIANTFKDYDEHLIFETLNEPRTEGSAKEWSGGTEPERKVVYNLNADIVSAIRATGGNNKYRHIIVPTYAATSMMNILREAKLPKDDRIILSVHAYSPYFFAMNGTASGDFTEKDKRELDNFFSDLNKYFVSQGQAVVIGECGCINKNNLEDRIEWCDYYVKGAKKYGIPCFWWDNGTKRDKSGEETFGIYDRSKTEWSYPEIAEALTKAAK